MNKKKIKKYRLGNSQKLLLLFQLLNRKKSDGNVCGSITIHEKLDIPRLEEAINKLVENNDAIRTRICFSGLGFKQYFAKYEPFKVEVFDVNDDEEVKEIENTINHEVFSMINKPLYKIKIYRFKDGTGGFIGCMHHIICDAWTIGLCIREIMGYYYNDNAEFDTYSYSEYVNGEKEYLKSNRYIKDQEYWKTLINNEIPPAAVIEGDLNIESKTRKCGNCMFTIEKSIIDKIDTYCKKMGISQCTFFTGVYSLFIGKEAKLDNFMLDTIIANRTNYKEKNTLGLFAKTSGFLAKIENSSFGDYILGINKELLKTYKHYKYSTAKILKMVHKKEPKRKRLSKIWFSFQNTKLDQSIFKSPHNTRWTPLESTYLYDMLIELYDLNCSGELNIIYYYQIYKYSIERITQVHNGIYNIINQVLENNEINIEDIKIDETVLI